MLHQFFEKAAVCPNHPFGSKPYGYIDYGALAGGLMDSYPDNCGSKATNGNQRCTYTVSALDETTQTTVDYAYLWSDRSTNKDGNPSYYYGGLFWAVVGILHTFIFLHLANCTGKPKELVLAMSTRCAL